jgi:nucleoside-diphosphate-sugar epimerase
MYVSDAARAIVAVADRGALGRVYCIGSGKGRKLSEYVTDIRDVFAPNAEIKFGVKEYYPHQPMYLVADIEQLREDTGFEVGVDFKEGVLRMKRALDKR